MKIRCGSWVRKTGWRQGLFLVVMLGIFLNFNVPVAQAHAGYDRSNPPANGRLPAGQMPAQVQIWFTEPIEPRFSELNVFDKAGNRVDRGDSHVPPGEDKSLVVSLKPGLSDESYTVIFKNASTEDGHTLKGSFAFLVGAGELPTGLGSSPLDLAERTNASSGGENANFWSVSLRWLNYLSGTALVGALAYVLLVWRGAVNLARTSGRMGPQLDTAYIFGLRKARLVIWVALGGLALGWLGWYLYQAGAFSGQSLWQLVGLGVETGATGVRALTDFLFSSRYGLVWLARLGLIIVTLVAWMVAVRGETLSLSGGSNKLKLPGSKHLRQNLLPAEESGQQTVTNSASKATVEIRQQVALLEARQLWWWLTLVFSTAILFTNSLNSHASGVDGWSWLAIMADWLHLLGVAVWVGGLVTMVLGLTIALPALLPGSGDRTRLLAALIPTFSQVAILSVTTLVLTGTVGALFQLRDLTELFSSPYGISLTVKILLLIPLLLLAAYNLLVVSPRLRAFARSKKAGPKEGAGSIAAGVLGLNFRRAILAEMVIAFVVLLAAAFLTSNAPSKSLAGSNVLYFQSEQANLKVDLGISPGTVGQNTFEARLTDKTTGQPVPDATLVDLRLVMQEMDMGTPHLELKSVDTRSGRYLGQGPILSMAGTWQATLVIQRNGQEDVRIPVSFKIK